MSLTAQFYAGDTDKLWVNANGGGIGIHTVTPSNGSLVGVWQDEATPATRNVVLGRTNDSTRPSYSTPGSMLLPSISLDGTDDHLSTYSNTVMVPVTAASLVGASAKTIVGSFRMAGAATNNANIYQNSALICDESAYFGVHAKSNGGTHEVFGYNWDGSADTTAAISISLNTDYVFMLRHDGTTLTLSILSGSGGSTRTNQSVSSGATVSLLSPMRVGRSYQTHCFNGYVGEIYIDNTDLGSTNTPLSDIVGRWLPASPKGKVVARRSIHKSLLAR